MRENRFTKMSKEFNFALLCSPFTSLHFPKEFTEFGIKKNYNWIRFQQEIEHVLVQSRLNYKFQVSSVNNE